MFQASVTMTQIYRRANLVENLYEGFSLEERGVLARILRLDELREQVRLTHGKQRVERVKFRSIKALSLTRLAIRRQSLLRVQSRKSVIRHLDVIVSIHL